MKKSSFFALACMACFAGCGEDQHAPLSKGDPLQPTTKLAAASFAPKQIYARNTRTPDQIVFHRPNVYDYVPTIMLDGVYRMWWCGGVQGDHILYAEASDLNGPWHARGSTVPNSFNDVFRPTGNASDFDATHTCDPSVVRASDGTYTMFYGGYGDKIKTTQVGAASSPDGLSWTRLNGGKPIVGPARPSMGLYGAGQPSAIFLNGKYYLAYTDLTGRGNNPVNRAGVFALRSSDRTFQTGVEEMGKNGWAPMTAANHTAYAAVESFSVDWVYSDALNAFIFASDNDVGRTNFWILDTNMKWLGSGNDKFSVAGSWRDGPGIVSRPDGHALPNGSCTDISLDILRATSDGLQSGTNGWDIAHSGIDLRVKNVSCATMPVAAMYAGFIISAPKQPTALVLGGKRISLDVMAPAQRVSRNRMTVPQAMFASIPYAGTLQRNNPAIQAPGFPWAYLFKDTNTIMPLGCMNLVDDVQASTNLLSKDAYGAYKVGPAWYCLK